MEINNTRQDSVVASLVASLYDLPLLVALLQDDRNLLIEPGCNSHGGNIDRVLEETREHLKNTFCRTADSKCSDSQRNGSLRRA